MKRLNHVSMASRKREKKKRAGFKFSIYTLYAIGEDSDYGYVEEPEVRKLLISSREIVIHAIIIQLREAMKANGTPQHKCPIMKWT